MTNVISYYILPSGPPISRSKKLSLSQTLSNEDFIILDEHFVHLKAFQQSE